MSSIEQRKRREEWKCKEKRTAERRKRNRKWESKMSSEKKKTRRT